MSKITFRADDDLVERIEAIDRSKSEIMRDALRSYLERAGVGTHDLHRGASDNAPDADPVETLLADRLAADGRDVNITISVDPQAGGANRATAQRGSTEPNRDGADRCAQCGDAISSDHVYCPNCGEKRSRRIFCECGDELRSDWSFCPGCGRRTPAADVLDRS